MKALVAGVLLLVVVPGAVAATAAGRHWRLSIDSLQCQGALLVVGAKIRYLGPKGPVEAPVIALADAQGVRHSPSSLVWKQGAKPVADWMAGGGLTLLQTEELGEAELRFPVPEAGGELKLEFGDVPAFAVTKGGCAGLLKPAMLKAPAPPRRASAADAKAGLSVHRLRYPCRSKSSTGFVEAEYPPYLPQRLLVLGRGYLPNARDIALPMGRAPAQSYAFSGAEDRKTVEALARRIAATDFPQYGPAGHFAYDWGLQRAASGNEIWSVGIYELRACPAQK
jgi:hypothetical protein